MSVAQLRGMRYPDEYLIRFFYKEDLHRRTGRVLELGCGSANNLLHFAAYGWDVVGVDYDAGCVADGRHNLAASNMAGRVIQHDLNTGLPPLTGPFHALLAPSTLYYLRREAAWACLRQAADLLAPGAALYVRMRLPDDHRVGRGTLEGPGAWRLDTNYTGEKGALNVFWQEHELLELLHDTLGLPPERLTILRVAYDNVQDGRLIRNSDIVLWGRLP